MLCKVAADELGEHRVRVNLVRPGLTRTGAPTHPSSDKEAMDAYYVQQPLQQAGEPRNIAAGIRYFLGPESDWTTGQMAPCSSMVARHCAASPIWPSIGTRASATRWTRRPAARSTELVRTRSPVLAPPCLAPRICGGRRSNLGAMHEVLAWGARWSTAPAGPAGGPTSRSSTAASSPSATIRRGGPAPSEVDLAGLRARPGLHRHPHPLRRPGVLGPGPHAVVVARRHDRRPGQLRLRHRTDPAGRPATLIMETLELVEGMNLEHAAGRHRLVLRDLPRVPRRRRPAAQAHQRRRLRPAQRRCAST